jgi:hypothetical protein
MEVILVRMSFLKDAIVSLVSWRNRCNASSKDSCVIVDVAVVVVFVVTWEAGGFWWVGGSLGDRILAACV